MAISQCLLIMCFALLLMVAMAGATQFRVGGPQGWTVLTDPNANSYNQWAQKNRFQIGDSLLFVYPPGRDSVLQVTLDAYSTCKTSSYIQRFDDGNTIFPLTRSGPYYFISGDMNNCLKGESTVVAVMANRSNRTSSSSHPSVTPAIPSSPPSAPLVSSPPVPPLASSVGVPPTPTEVSPSLPPPAPLAASPPLPPPTTPAEVLTSPPPPPSTGEVPTSPPPPPPPPPTTAEVSPSPAPPGESSPPPPPRPNGAASKVVGFMCSFGALCGSLLILL